MKKKNNQHFGCVSKKKSFSAKLGAGGPVRPHATDTDVDADTNVDADVTPAPPPEVWTHPHVCKFVSVRSQVEDGGGVGTSFSQSSTQRSSIGCSLYWLWALITSVLVAARTQLFVLFLINIIEERLSVATISSKKPTSYLATRHMPQKCYYKNTLIRVKHKKSLNAFGSVLKVKVKGLFNFQGGKNRWTHLVD